MNTKKLALVAAFLFMTPHLFADSSIPDSAPSASTQGAVDDDPIETLDSMSGETMDLDLNAEGVDAQQSRLIRRLIGGLLGFVADIAFEDERYDWERRHYRNRYPYNTDIRRPVTCFAESRSGRVFRGTSSSNARRAQDRAFQACYSRSLECRPLGCEFRGR